jgi:hypothetical protein
MSLTTGRTATERRLETKVGGVLTDNWQSTRELANRAGLSHYDASMVLSSLQARGEAEYRRDSPNQISYRKKPQKPEKPKWAKFERGAFITDDVARGLVTGYGRIGRNIPAYEVDMGGGRAGAIIASQARLIA